ncbi:MAG: hydrogenase 2 operon protein HybA [Alphaproteobacteria bacterium]|jgi:Fe-S-cluster-containing dehydrogenase component|nr:hydrogenase 2 operon protein HybA [Alphaproteobacteria bacterium]
MDRDLSRRNFLKGAAAAGCASVAAVGGAEDAEARDNLALPPGALGLLFDSTLCTGCRACVTACKTANFRPLDGPADKPYLDETKALSPKALNVIQMYADGTVEVKDRETDGFAFIKHSCMHCVDPCCVSVCPVTALEKDPMTGIVSYDKDACIGCRYCVASCPYRIPRFDYDKPFPEIHKCELCRHLLPEGKFSACADACPTGATLFGPVVKLHEEITRRKALEPGEMTRFPRRSTETGDKSGEKPAATYIDHVYGEVEGGGTQMLMMSGVPFEKLGLPTLPERSYAAVSETLQHTLYKGLFAPALVLGGLLFATYRTSDHDDDEDDDENGSEDEQGTGDGRR